MEYGIVLPKHINPDELIKFAKAAEDLGFHSLWAADHIVLPIEETNLIHTLTMAVSQQMPRIPNSTHLPYLVL